MRLLDLFCGAGGAAMGYSRAGFDEIVGVDIKPQPRYPFTFVQGDALEYVREHGREFDVVHASPPCQSYSRAMRHLASPQPKLIEQLLRALGPYVYIVENVAGAPLPCPLMLCGTQFGLRVHRHRYFQTNPILFLSSGCQPSLPVLNPHRATSRQRLYREFGRQDPEKLWGKEMGVGWMSRHETRESIPPAYTEFIGHQLIASFQGEPA